MPSRSNHGTVKVEKPDIYCKKQASSKTKKVLSTTFENVEWSRKKNAKYGIYTQEKKNGQNKE